MYFSIKYRNSDILLEKKHQLHLQPFAITRVNMVSVTSASLYITSVSRYHPLHQSRSSMCICGLIPRNSAELAEPVPIDATSAKISCVGP